MDPAPVGGGRRRYDVLGKKKKSQIWDRVDKVPIKYLMSDLERAERALG
jgi:hypothetical protein